MSNAAPTTPLVTDASLIAHYDALEGLVRGVEAFFKAQGVTASVDVGWTRRSRQDNQGPGGANRVVFIPGEFDASPSPPKVLRYGELDLEGEQNQVTLAPRLRTIAWLHGAYTCSVWAADASAPTDERKQIWRTKQLLRWTLQAMQNAVDPLTEQPVGGANLQWGGTLAWTLPPGEQAFGRELCFEFRLLEPQHDVPIATAYPGTAVVARSPAT
jgi:hypothetical protein